MMIVLALFFALARLESPVIASNLKSTMAHVLKKLF
jgi:hypothetical protein